MKPSHRPKMYTLQDIETARQEAFRLGLRGSALFCSLPIAEVQQCCNGIGAAWMPEASRILLNKRFPVLQTAAMIHDVRYSYGSGTDEDFHNANYELYENGKLLACEKFKWYNPVRYVVIYDARRLARVCDAFGRQAYFAALIRREGKALQ